MVVIAVQSTLRGTRLAADPAVLAAVDLDVVLVGQVERRHVRRPFPDGPRLAALRALLAPPAVDGAAADSPGLALACPDGHDF
jgi:hypothetical protein